jgi:large subunit ribosomal protein L30
MFAVIRLRGTINTAIKVKKTLELMKLNTTNHCVLVPNSPTTKGMLNVVQSYVTWGEVDPKLVEILVKRRGRLEGDKRVDEKQAKEFADKINKNTPVKDLPLKPVFRLSPPKKGLKSIRLSHPRGDLGYRGDKINALLEKMI